MTHEITVVYKDGHHIAHCSCGWKSRPLCTEARAKHTGGGHLGGSKAAALHKP